MQTLIASGFGLIGNTNTAYAAEDQPQSYVEENLTTDSPSSDLDQTDRDKIEEGNQDPEADLDDKENNSQAEVEPADGEDSTHAEADLANKETSPQAEEGQTLQPASLIEDAPQEVEAMAISAENIAAAQQASNSQESTDKNYSEDEKEIQDYDGSERYRETDLQPGDTNQEFYKTDEKEEKDGFKFELKNPSATSPSMTEYGYQITIDKKTGQRTYTKIYVTDSGLIPVDKGNKQMMSEGDKLTPGSPGVTYKPNENTEITASRSQRNLNYEASEETLKHINNKDNPSTSFGFEDNYTSDNSNTKFFGDNFALGYKVNPWPNENDNLKLMKLNGEYNDKVFVQGQDIDTGIKVENVDKNAKERLVGQVYHPVTGKVVPGASAYIDDNSKIHIKLPEGALKLDGGKYVVNENSIFAKDPDYKGLTHLDVKFFARPRTAEEFKNIAETPDDFGGTGTYVETGAGTADINHKGNNVTIDKQGIDRYDHYNLIGGFNINLDDTRYYDQEFKDEDENKIDPNASTSVSPGKKATIRILDPSTPGGTQKTSDEMDEAYSKGEATGKLKEEYLIAANKKIARELGITYDELMKEENKDKRWVIDGKADNISHFTITAPKDAKAGDTIALPVEYTYTNGSTDTRWFHFVVQESTLNKPEYEAQVDFPSEEQKSPARVPEDKKKLDPVKYSIKEGFNYKDDHDNEWTVSIDEETGQVTAKPKESGKFNGGEKLKVPVVAHYDDPLQEDEDITEETTAEFIIKERANMTPRYNAKAGKAGDKLSSAVIIDEEDKFNRRPTKFTIESNTYTDDKGNTWHVTINEGKGTVTATVPNAEEGKSIDGALLNVPVTAHYYESDGKEVGTREVEVQFIASGTNGKYEKIEEIPFETKVEKDPNLKKGEIQVITEGEKGSKQVTYVIKDSVVDETKTSEKIIKEAQDRLIHVGEGVLDGSHSIEEKQEIPFETIVEFDDSLAPGEQKVEVEGAPGEQTRTTTLTIEDGNVTKTEEGEFTQTKAPVNRVIKVGRNTEGKVVHKEDLPFGYTIREVDDLKKGEYKIIKDGKVGTKTTTWIIKNSQVDGEPTVDIDPAEDAIIHVGKGTNNGTHTIEEKAEVPFEVEIEFDDSLAPGEQKVTQEGVPGEKTRTNTLTIEDGKVTNTEEGEFSQTKAPVKKIIKVGRNTEGKVVHEEKIPFKYNISYDENLKSGEYVIDVPGTEGTKTTTWTIKNSEIVEEPSTNITNPVDAVIRVGKKDYTGEFSHDVKEKIPFKVKIIEDDTIPAGQTKVDQEGKAGEKTTTFTQAIKNGQPDGELKSKSSTTKEPVEHIIRVGKKAAKNNESVTSEVDVKVNYVYDNNKPLGYLQVDDLVKGKVTTTIVNEYDPETGEIKTVEKTVVEPGTRQVTIGTKNHTGDIEEEVKKIIPFETTIEFDDTMKAGEQKIVQVGENGEKSQTITRKIVNGEVTEENKSELKTTKEAKNQIIKVGTMTNGTHKHKEEIPFEYTIEYDPKLKAGEYREETPGRVGERTTTWTIKNSRIVEKDVTETKPINAVIKVGNKDFTGSFETKKERPIEFETEYIVDNSLEPGTTEVIQPGELGIEETTVTHTIKNGTVEESKEGTPVQTKAPSKRIVKIGLAKTDGTHTYTSKKPYEVEVRVNPNIPKGEYKVVQKGLEGEEEYTITIENSKVTKTSEPKETKAPVNEIIEVGSQDFTGTHETKKTKAIDYETEYIVDNSLEPGTTKVEQEGELGEEETTAIHTIVNGQVTKSEDGETKQTKAPVKKIVKVGPGKTDGTHEYTNKIPFEVEVRVNPALKKGEHKVVQKGVEGEEKYTLTIENSKVTKTSDPITTKAPVKEIIEVGSEDFTGKVEHTEELPFGYKVEEVDDLKKGEYRIVKPGKVGTKHTTWNIKNSEIDGEPNEVIVEAEDALIQVGKGTNDGTYDIEEKKEIPFETKYEYDDSLEPGEKVVKQEGRAGLEKRTNTLIIKDGKVVETKEGTFERTLEPIDRIIKIGRKPTEGETTKTIEREIPYETKVIYDETLEAGFQKIENEGKPGKEEVTITQKIKDSKPVGDPTETTKTITKKRR